MQRSLWPERRHVVAPNPCSAEDSTNSCNKPAGSLKTLNQLFLVCSEKPQTLNNTELLTGSGL